MKIIYILCTCLLCISLKAQAQDKQTSQKTDHRWRIGVQGGLGYMLANMAGKESGLRAYGMSSGAAKDYYKTLKWGYSAGADAHFIFGKCGIGFKYTIFTTSVQQPIVSSGWSNYLYAQYYDREEQVYINFIGTSFYLQQWLNQSHTLKINSIAAIGYAHYRREIRYNNNYRYKSGASNVDYYSLSNSLALGGTIAGNVDVSLEYFPLKWFSVSANTGLFLASLGKLKTTSGNYSKKDDLDEHENLSRLDFSIGIRFYL